MKRCLIISTFLLSVLVGCSSINTPKLSIDDLIKQQNQYIKSYKLSEWENNRPMLYMNDEFFNKPLTEQFDALNQMRDSYVGNKDFVIFHNDNEPLIYRFSDDTFQIFSTGDRFKINNAKKELANYDKNLVFDFKPKESTSTPLFLLDSDKRDAWSNAQVYVKEKLKSPSSAKFPLYDSNFVSSSGDIITVNSYIDANNGFGAKLRKNFTLTMDRNYSLESIYIEE